jgi:hypothetical protein
MRQGAAKPGPGHESVVDGCVGGSRGAWWLGRLGLMVAALLGALAGLPAGAAAFDTGYHSDLTSDALLREGFSPDAVRVAQATNCYDDMFMAAKTVLEDEDAAALHEAWDAIFGPKELRDLSDEYEHFDDCADYVALKERWDRLLKGTRAAVQDVVQRPQQGRAIRLISVVGQSLHEVQDFYAHTNWPHYVAHPDWDRVPGVVRDETWFEVDDAVKAGLDLHTNSHVLQNKDWAGLDHFDRAYHEAFLATWEWVRMLRAWVGEPLWQEAAAYTSGAAVGEVTRLTRLAMYVEDGHWKGPGSGNTDELTDAAISYAYYHAGLVDPRVMQQTQDLFLLAWKDYCPLICADRRDEPLPAALPRPVTHPVWLAIDTLSAAEAGPRGGGIDVGSDPDFFAVVTVNGAGHMTNIMQNMDDISPAHWRTWIPLEPDSTVTLSYALWDADGTESEQCDIAAGERRDWAWSGPVEQAPAGVVETQGSLGGTASSAAGKEAFVRFRVMREPVTSVVAPEPTGRHGWYTAPLSVELVAHDWSGAGIDHVDYSVSQGTATDFRVYDGPIAIAEEGETALLYFGTDTIGNLEDAHERVFRVDGSRPVPLALNRPTVKRGATCLLQYEVQDALPSSGTALATVKVRAKSGKVVKTLGGTVWQAVNSVWTVRFSPGKLMPGKYACEVYATDFAGNHEEKAARSYVVVK